MLPNCGGEIYIYVCVCEIAESWKFIILILITLLLCSLPANPSPPGFTPALPPPELLHRVAPQKEKSGCPWNIHFLFPPQNVELLQKLPRSEAQELGKIWFWASNGLCRHQNCYNFEVLSHDPAGVWYHLEGWTDLKYSTLKSWLFIYRRAVLCLFYCFFWNHYDGLIEPDLAPLKSIPVGAGL